MGDGMSVMINWFGAIIGGVIGWMAASTLGVTRPLAWTIVVPMALLGFAAWIYSPLPDGGGHMAGDPNTGWGWPE